MGTAEQICEWIEGRKSMITGKKDKDGREEMEDSRRICKWGYRGKMEELREMIEEKTEGVKVLKLIIRGEFDARIGGKGGKEWEEEGDESMRICKDKVVDREENTEKIKKSGKERLEMWGETKVEKRRETSNKVLHKGERKRKQGRGGNAMRRRKKRVI